MADAIEAVMSTAIVLASIDRAYAVFTSQVGARYSKSVMIQALATNTGYVYIGNASGVNATNAIAVLDSGQSITFETSQMGLPGGGHFDLSGFWVIPSVAGEAVFGTYLRETGRA